MIKILEEKFKKINIALNNSTAKPDLIKNRFKNDQDQIQNKHLEPAPYETGLNESRDEMLKQLITKRNEQLKQVNDFFQANPQSSPALLTNLANEDYLSILSMKGAALHVKKMKYDKFSFKVNATNIVVHYSEKRLVEVYDFKLELLHFFSLDKIHRDFTLSANYEIFFLDTDACALTICNYKTSQIKRKEIELNKNLFSCYNKNTFHPIGLHILNLNEKFVYFRNYGRNFTPNYWFQHIYVFDRASFVCLYKFELVLCGSAFSFVIESDLYFIREEPRASCRHKIYRAGRKEFELEGKVRIKNIRQNDLHKHFFDSNLLINYKDRDSIEITSLF